MKVSSLIIAALLFLGVACSNQKPELPIKSGFVLSDTMQKTLQTETVQLIPLKNQLKVFGKIIADNNKVVEVYPIVGGNVIQVFAELGDYVTKGSVLASIRSAEVAGFQEELESAKNDFIMAKKNLKVAEEMLEGKLISEKDLVLANSEFEKSQAKLKRIEEVFRIYHLKNQSIYEVQAPISGFVIQKNINQDMLLRSDKTDNIFDIAQIDDVSVIANVSESDISKIKLGEDAYITTISYQDKLLKGKVDKIYNVIDPETKAMKVRIKLPNSDYLLKPEMRANIRLDILEDGSKLAIPSKAIIFDKSKYFVMVYYSKTKIETREISIFRQVGDLTYIESGLSEGDKVITQNQLLIYDALND